MKKESSPTNKVSDECLGEMLADRYLIMREGLNKEASSGSVFGGGTKSLARGLSYMAPALLLGGAIHAAGSIADAVKRKKLHNEADEAFKKIHKNSEIIHENPELALEALDAIKTFAPALASKPSVLKTFVEHTVRVGSMAPQTINDLAVAQANVGKAKPAGFASGFFTGLSPVVGIGKDLSSTGEDEAMFNKLENRP